MLRQLKWPMMALTMQTATIEQGLRLAAQELMEKKKSWTATQRPQRKRSLMPMGRWS